MNEGTKYENLVPTYERPLSALEIRQQVNLIQEVLRDVMVAGTHYGFPPGTEPKTEEEKKLKKPSLLKPGAELLCVVFRLAPRFTVERTRLPAGHLEVVSNCDLTYIPNGRFVGHAMGSATTEESKHAYRWAGRECPGCGVEAIIKGRREFGGGWLCFARKGGCGTKFDDGDPRIEGQEVGRIANPDLADQYGTVLKMANKRAQVAVVLNATAASDMFAQDLEDLSPEADGVEGDPNRQQRPEPGVEHPRRKSHDSAGAGGAHPTGASSSGAGASAGHFKPLLPQMKTMAEARLKKAGLTKLDLKAHFNKDLDATDEKGFAFGDWEAIERWISENSKS